MSECHRTKSLSKGIKIVSNERSSNSLHSSQGEEDWLNANKTADHAGSYKTLSV